MQQIQIRLKGQIDERWSEWLDGLEIAHTAENETVLTGLIRDQSALYGLMTKLRDLGLPLAAVTVGDEVSGEQEWGPGPIAEEGRKESVGDASCEPSAAGSRSCPDETERQDKPTDPS